MNQPSNDNRPGSCRGFTIIELLTVVMCITILMSITVPIGRAMLFRAYAVRTKAQFSQWGSAAEMFRAEYGKYPKLDGTQTVGKEGVNIQGVINVSRFAVALTGHGLLPSENNQLHSPVASSSLFVGNQKLITFYNFGPKDILVDEDKTNLQDAYGNIEIGVLVDTNMDGVIDFADGNKVAPVNGANGGIYDPKKSGDLDLTSSSNVTRAGIIFYSAGEGNSSGDGKDDVDSKAAVRSWEARKPDEK